MNVDFQWIAVAFFVGAAIALSELLSRYSWRIRSIIFSSGGLLYMSVNGGVAALVYYASVQWELFAGLKEKSEFWRTLVVSFLAMAILRSSLNFKVGNHEFGAGFSAFIDVFKGYAERILDQNVTKDQLEAIGPFIVSLTYVGSRNFLLSMCGTALQSIRKDEKAVLDSDLKKIDQMTVSDSAKMRLFALRLSQITGVKLFKCIAADAKNCLSSENALVAQHREAKLRELADVRSRL
jgi:hypothetical protein